MKLKDITLSIFDGKHGDCKDKEGSGVYFISVKDLREYEIDYSKARQIDEVEFEQNYKRTNLEVGDTIYANTGDTIGKSLYVVDNPLVAKTSFQKSVAVVKPNKSFVEPKYLYYLLKFETPRLRKAATGSGQKNLLLSSMREFEISIHDREIQKQIATVLGTIDDKIRVNCKINDNLEQQAKLIYDYWFTQFDFPDENGKPYCSSGGKMVWNEQLKRNIPENWNVVPLLKLVSWESNSQPPKSKFVYEPKEGYVRFIQNRDYDSDTHITYIPRTKNLSIVDRFDILMDKYGDAGAVRYGIEGAFNVALGKICVHNPNYREYIRSFLGSDGIYKFLHNSCMASTRASLSEANLAILNVVVPDEKIILDYENFLHKIRVSILKNKDETVELINLRDWLLPMLMNGQAIIED